VGVELVLAHATRHRAIAAAKVKYLCGLATPPTMIAASIADLGAGLERW
jgi:hypothetical protein